MALHFNHVKKALVSLAIIGISFNMQMSANAQTVTREQLDRLSLQELIILRNEQLRQANIVVANCYNSPYIPDSTCYAMELQYTNYFANLDNYIAQRQVIGQ
ncbi:UrcA family protein [Nostoc sp. DSM 114160]|jgi:putative lipase involved disintegration of autophagic bodies